ncbi:MAG TPA: amidinotransferase [Candidatus Saccharibacteria bacterium]|nr:amidinotransferase [Candidatus Saccharibacteria bacterium]
MSKINNSILMSDANNFSTDCPINPYYHLNHVNREEANNEHGRVRQLLTEAGVKVTSIPSPAGCQDGIYTANWALVRGDKAVLSSLPNARKNEEEYAEKILTDLGKQVFKIPSGLKFSGQGDALPCGNLLFCGQGYRSDAEAQSFAANILDYELVQLRTVPQLDSFGKPIINSSTGWCDSYFYDLDMALAIIKGPDSDKKGLIAYCPEAFQPESREILKNLDGVEKIEVSIKEAKEAFATNLVSTGETVIMSNKAPKLANNLQNTGLTVICPDLTEIAKGGGYIRCITLTLD